MSFQTFTLFEDIMQNNVIVQSFAFVDFLSNIHCTGKHDMLKVFRNAF